ncbi:MAG: low-specificity L-threonine aldolase, partial [Gammaproteobacteria bacterium]|nr:low-specificity L-threonine aldolase [Gammaproteobacteria bacterium]
LVGTRELIEKAHRWRKMTGGGMRQAGILAEAGIYALENNVQRLIDDHEKAKVLAKGLSEIEGLNADLINVHTNMVFVDMDVDRKEQLMGFLKERGIKTGGYDQLRLVTHHDIDAADIALVIEAFREFTSTNRQT